MKNYFECCNHCTKRKIGCHGKCKEFKEAKENNDKRNDEIKRCKKNYRDLTEYDIKTHQRLKKNKSSNYVRYA